VKGGRISLANLVGPSRKLGGKVLFGGGERGEMVRGSGMLAELAGMGGKRTTQRKKGVKRRALKLGGGHEGERTLGKKGNKICKKILKVLFQGDKLSHEGRAQGGKALKERRKCWDRGSKKRTKDKVPAR